MQNVVDISEYLATMRLIEAECEAVISRLVELEGPEVAECGKKAAKRAKRKIEKMLRNEIRN